jgi:hypothetical protein
MKGILPTALLAALAILGIGSLYKGVSAAPMAALAINAHAPSSSTPPSVSESTAQDAARGLRKYKNTAFHFSLLYPQNLQLQEYKELGGGLTVTFQDVAAQQEVQVFVTPYGDAQITDARFKLDEPSGIKIDSTNIVVDGAKGMEFFSSAPTMDDTREVWFIKNGYLYEVTTFKELDSWLQQILQTWQFI